MLTYAEQFNFQYIINEIAFCILLFHKAQICLLILGKNDELEMASLLYDVLCYSIQIQSSLQVLCVFGVFLYSKSLSAV